MIKKNTNELPPIPAGWGQVFSGVAKSGDQAWNSKSWASCAWIGKEHHLFRCLIRRNRAAKKEGGKGEKVNN